MKNISKQKLEELGIPTNAYIIGSDEYRDVTIWEASRLPTMWIWVVQKTGEIYDVDKFEYVSSKEYRPALTEYDNKY